MPEYLDQGTPSLELDNYVLYCVKSNYSDCLKNVWGNTINYTVTRERQFITA